MESESGVKGKEIIIDDQMRKEINYFLTKKRRAIIKALAENDELSQGDLAIAIKSTATSLSNIILKFEQYKYKLLNGKSVGKYRYYALSDIGKAYARDMDGKTNQGKKCSVSDDVDMELFQTAKESLVEFEILHGGEWETQFDNALMRRIYGNGRRLDEKSESLVNQYLKCIEILAVQKSEMIMNQVLALLKNLILRDRVEEFMDYFEPFIPVLKGMGNKNNLYAICMIVKSVFSEQEDSLVVEYIRKAGWKDKEYDCLKEIVPHLKKCIYGYSDEEIYQYFDGLLPNQEILSICISQWISDF